MHYFPLSPLFMVLGFAAFAVLVAVVEFGLISYAYEKMGVGRRYIFSVLLLSLLGSAINIPIAEISGKDTVVEREVNFFGVWYVVPAIEHRGRTVLAINLGGALIPLVLSIFLLVRNEIYGEAMIGVTIVAFATYLLARPVPGVGIAIPPLVPPPWPISPAAWAASSARTFSIFIASRNSARRSRRSAARASRTAFS
jgi:uncharacterized membrane protein